MKKKYGTALPVYEGKADNDSIAQNGHTFHTKGCVTLSALVWKKS